MKKALIALLAVSAILSLPSGADAGKIRVMFLGKGPSTFSKNVGALIHESNPDITVEPVYLSEDYIARAVIKKCDLFMGDVWVIQGAMNKGILEDLDQWMPKETMDGIPMNFLEPYTIGKKTYAIPFGGNSQSFIYNMDLFRSAGVAPPDETWTWEDQCLKAATKLAKDGNGDGKPETYGFGYLLGLGREYLTIFNSYGGKLYDPVKGMRTYGMKPGLDAIGFMLDMFSTKAMVPVSDWNLDKKETPFYQGKSGMDFWFNGKEEWAQAFMDKNKIKLNVGLAPIPKGPKGSVPNNTQALACIFRTGTNKKDAARALDYFMSPKFQLTRIPDGTLPTTIRGLASPEVAEHFPSWYVNSYRNGRIRSIDPAFESAENNMWWDLAEVAAGRMTLKGFIAKGSK